MWIVHYMRWIMLVSGVLTATMVQAAITPDAALQYGHAALLVASCVAFAPKSRASELLRWAADLRQQHWRRHAFREELARACESLGVLVPV